MKKTSAWGFAAKVIIFLFAFLVVVWVNVLVFPEITSDAGRFLRSGNYFPILMMFAETFILGAIFRKLLIWAFRMEFERR